MTIQHPIEKNKLVEYRHPVCACTGRTWVSKTGTIVSSTLQSTGFYTYKIRTCRHNLAQDKIINVLT